MLGHKPSPVTAILIAHKIKVTVMLFEEIATTDVPFSSVEGFLGGFTAGMSVVGAAIAVGLIC